MAYSESVGNNARLLRRAVTGLRDFSGRSRRTELIYYWIASGLVGVVFNFVAIAVVPFEAIRLFDSALQFVLMIPMFALVVRRLHDQDRSGWWGLLLPLSLVLSFPRLVTEIRGDVAEMIASQTTPVGIAAGLCALAVFVLCLLRGTEGANRYGPDPRLDDA